MPIRLSDKARRYIALFERETGVVATDCLVDDVVTFVVAPDDMSRAIGPDGRTVGELEERIGRDVALIEDATTPDVFVANSLAPAAVYSVQIEERDGESIAVASIDEADIGVAIGGDGHRIERARHLAKRHFGIDDIELEEADRAKDAFK